MLSRFWLCATTQFLWIVAVATGGQRKQGYQMFASRTSLSCRSHISRPRWSDQQMPSTLVVFPCQGFESTRDQSIYSDTNVSSSTCCRRPGSLFHVWYLSLALTHQVSFMDGGGAGGGPTSTANYAMFRCKTLVHTTGSAPTAGGGDGGNGAGWPHGEFQFEVCFSLRMDVASQSHP